MMLGYCLPLFKSIANNLTTASKWLGAWLFTDTIGPTTTITNIITGNNVNSFTFGGNVIDGVGFPNSTAYCDFGLGDYITGTKFSYAFFIKLDSTASNSGVYFNNPNTQFDSRFYSDYYRVLGNNVSGTTNLNTFNNSNIHLAVTIDVSIGQILVYINGLLYQTLSCSIGTFNFNLFGITGNGATLKNLKNPVLYADILSSDAIFALSKGEMPNSSGILSSVSSSWFIGAYDFISSEVESLIEPMGIAGGTATIGNGQVKAGFFQGIEASTSFNLTNITKISVGLRVLYNRYLGLNNDAATLFQFDDIYQIFRVLGVDVPGYSGSIFSDAESGYLVFTIDLTLGQLKIYKNGSLHSSYSCQTGVGSFHSIGVFGYDGSHTTDFTNLVIYNGILSLTDIQSMALGNMPYVDGVLPTLTPVSTIVASCLSSAKTYFSSGATLSAGKYRVLYTGNGGWNVLNHGQAGYFIPRATVEYQSTSTLVAGYRSDGASAGFFNSLASMQKYGKHNFIDFTLTAPSTIGVSLVEADYSDNTDYSGGCEYTLYQIT